MSAEENGHLPDPYAHPKLDATLGDPLYVHWNPLVTLEFSHIKDKSDGVRCEIVAREQARTGQPLPRMNLTLLAPRSRKEVAQVWEDLAPGHPWSRLLADGGELLLRHLRTPPPSEISRPRRRPPDAQSYLVPLWIPKNQVTVLYGLPGSGKSVLALALALGGLTGHPVGGLAVGPLSRVLYLDWESDLEDLDDRQWALSRLSEEAPDGAIRYRRMTRALSEVAEALRPEIVREGIDLVIVDALAQASGPEPEFADAAIRTLGVLRTFPGTKIVIAHRPKAQPQPGTSVGPFGSVYVTAIPRSVIEVSMTEPLPGDPERTMSLRHQKSNRTYAAPIGFGVSFDTDAGVIHMRRSEPDLSSQPLAAQILSELRSGAKSVTALAEATGVPAPHIRVVLHRLKKRNLVVRLDTLSTGRGNKALWGLVDTKRNSEA